MKSEPVKVTVNGIGAVSDFDGSITPEMTGTISLKAFGNASTPTVPAGYPKITPSSEGINLTESGNNTYSLTIDKAKAVAGDYTIDFGNGITYTFTVVNETVIVDVDGEEIKAVATPGQNIELDLTEAIGSDEIAIITDGNGNKIYDVNDDTLTPPEGYEYDKDSNTLTVTVAEGNDANINIIAKKIKASLYDAALTITDGKYTRPTLSKSMGQYGSVSEAYTAAKKMPFSNGVYIQITKDLKENFIGDGSDETFMTKPVTFDLNGHKWESDATKTRIINISLADGNIFNFVGGSFENSDLGKGSDHLGAVMYLYKAGTTLTGGNKWPDSSTTENGWAIVNIFETGFKNNYADCGGAICINGPVKLNIYNSEFDGSESLQNPRNGRQESGAAIYIYQSSTSGSGEIVNLYDCTFTNNSGMNLFAVQATNSGSYFNIYGGKFSGNTLYGNGAVAYLSAFNIYGGAFTGNYSFTDTAIENASAFIVAEENGTTLRPAFTIAGGIVSGSIGADYGFNIGNASNKDRITFSGGSFGAMVSGGAGSTTSFTPSDKTIVNATLDEAKKVEYISYTIDGDTVNVNINSPFKFDDGGKVVYKFADGFSALFGNEYNSSTYNAAVSSFSILLPSDKLDSISTITVHCADGTPVELTKSNSVDFTQQ